MLHARISLEVNVHKVASSDAPAIDNPPPVAGPLRANPARSWPWFQMVTGALGLAKAVADLMS